MTHYTVVVCTDDPSALAEIMAPWDENDPAEGYDSKWDWYVTGGRWAGHFRYKSGYEKEVIRGEGLEHTPQTGRCDGGPKYALDLSGMRDEAEAKARRRWDGWQEISKGHEPLVPWHTYTDNISEEGGYTIEKARLDYAGQPLMKIIRGTEFDGFADPAEEFDCSENTYLDRARFGAVPGYALVTMKREWVAPGEMGWFAMSSESPLERVDATARMDAYIRALPRDAFLIMVDCHV
jgi:hypothetical protein